MAKSNVPRDTQEQKQLKIIGRALRIARQDQKLKLQEVAEKSTVSSLTIAKLEKGELLNSSLQTLNKVAEVLSVEIHISTVSKYKQ